MGVRKVGPILESRFLSYKILFTKVNEKVGGSCLGPEILAGFQTPFLWSQLSLQNRQFGGRVSCRFRVYSGTQEGRLRSPNRHLE